MENDLREVIIGLENVGDGAEVGVEKRNFLTGRRRAATLILLGYKWWAKQPFEGAELREG